MHPSTTETRASLILRLPNARDVSAWDEVVAIYAPLVRRLAIKRGMQRADADDLVQVVFASISRSVAGWLERPDRGGFRVWLLSIARNAAVNLLTRRATRALATGGDDAAGMLAEMPAPSSELSVQFDLEYRQETFRWAASQVKQQVAESTWTAFWATHVEGQTFESAANQLGVSIGTIYVSRSRVMNRLIKVVKQYEVSK